MSEKILKKLRLGVAVPAMMVLALFAVPVMAAPPSAAPVTPANEACLSLKAADASVDCTSGQKVQDSPKVKNLITNVINVLSIITGVASVIMIIVGGFRYIVSAGDSNAVKGAKDTILYAVVGLAVTLFAQVIVRFVYSKASGV